MSEWEEDFKLIENEGLYEEYLQMSERTTSWLRMKARLQGIKR